MLIFFASPNYPSMIKKNLPPSAYLFIRLIAFNIDAYNNLHKLFSSRENTIISRSIVIEIRKENHINITIRIMIEENLPLHFINHYYSSDHLLYNVMRYFVG